MNSEFTKAISQINSFWITCTDGACKLYTYFINLVPACDVLEIEESVCLCVSDFG